MIKYKNAIVNDRLLKTNKNGSGVQCLYRRKHNTKISEKKRKSAIEFYDG